MVHGPQVHEIICFVRKLFDHFDYFKPVAHETRLRLHAWFVLCCRLPFASLAIRHQATMMAT